MAYIELSHVITADTEIWAKAVVGKRLRRNDDGEEEYEEVNDRI
ncbi:19265_t:CDS:2 [Rhizophagus irregularis]|nr:19265_t:CDS:2 [Rhizophagus irregularis]